MPQRTALPLLVLCTLLLSSCGTSSGSSSQPPATKETRSTSFKLRPPIPTAYAALGASETYGVGARPHTRGYAYLVARALHAHPFVNLGIPGTTIDAAYQAELTGALTVRPRLCTVFFGFNDTQAGVHRSAFLQDLNDTIVTLRRERCAALVIGLPDLSVLPRVRSSPLAPRAHRVAVTWNAGMRQVTRRTGARFLDLAQYSRELASHPEYISADGLHPSNAGYARLAQVLVNTIRRYKMFGPAR